MLNRLVKILIADDHELFRKGIISLLLKEDKIKIIGEANDGKDLIYKYFKLKPDLVITDISMPEISGIEAVRILSKKDPDVKVIFLSMYDGDDYIYHSIKSGGLGLINKNISKQELMIAIEYVSNGKKYFGEKYTEEQINRIVNDYEEHSHNSLTDNIEQLTNKEKEVLTLLAEGLTTSEIADKMYIGQRTVETHRSNIMEKLNLKSYPQLMKYAITVANTLKKQQP
ncbi:MAG: response regulator transcription factor [Ignavibacteriaceae bacterium]|nr:response regulator transcription factor [Ignavibacteriaceae bacterium]